MFLTFRKIPIFDAIFAFIPINDINAKVLALILAIILNVFYNFVIVVDSRYR